MTPLLHIQDLHVSADQKAILKGLSLTVKAGEIHALMGPNGSGKSTLAKVILGHPAYQITRGVVEYKGDDLAGKEVHERALNGIFLAFQNPKEIEGVNIEEFLLAAYRARQKHLSPKKPPILIFRFKKWLNELMEKLKMPEMFAARALNVGFSGGEKKKLEMLQMAVLQPDLALLDETDSGLDVDALKTISADIRARHQENPHLALVVITHYQHILKYLKPDHVHIMKHGRILRSGGATLARAVEKNGYDSF